MTTNHIARETAQLGASVLRQQSKKVDNIDSEEMVRLVDIMLNTLTSKNGVGIAAPQVFEPIRIVVIASKPSKRYPMAPEMDPVVMFNPYFDKLSDELYKDWEGCLSIPGIRALVPRYERIKVTYQDQQGIQQELLANGFIARIFQHEYDHLEGLVFLDRVTNNKDIISEIEYQKLIG